MFLLRLLGILTAIAVGAGLLVYLLTGNVRYLRLAWQLFRYALFLALLVFGLLILERLAVIPL